MKILGAVLELPAPRILIFSIAMGADYTFYVKTIETHTRAFLTLNILAIGRVAADKHETCRHLSLKVRLYVRSSKRWSTNNFV